MNTATPKRSLSTLEKQLQQFLDAQLLETCPIQVRCAIKNADLLVLAQHQDGVRPNLQQTFKAIHQGVLSLSPELAGELRLYLRVFGQVQPYAYHGFKLPQPLGVVNSPGENSSALSAFAWLEKLIEERAETEIPESEETLSEETLSEEPLSPLEPPLESALVLATEDDKMEQDDKAESSAITPFKGIEEFPEGLFNESDSAKEVQRQKLKFKELPSWSGQVSAYLFLSVTICSMSFYAFSRPCVVGKCETISQAEQLIDSAQQTLTQAQYAQHLEEVQEKFNVATRQLKQIPVWSGKRLEAGRLLKSYESEQEHINEVLKAMDSGATAWKTAQKSPLPIEVWREIRSHWSEAIALLETIPSESQVYPFAQKKLSEYQGNLKTIARRVKLEENAAETLEQIQIKSDLAYTRQGVAATLESWEGIYELWKQILNLTATIPEETMAYSQLQDRLEEYRRQQGNARQRVIEEQIGEEAFNQAIARAEQAQQFSQDKELSLALNRWTDALTYIRQVPANTFYYVKAQSLVPSYVSARNQAAVDLKTAITLENTQTALKKLCNGNPIVCEYTVTEEVLNVWLTAAYVRKVKRTALLADRNGDRKALVGVDQHLDTLKVALQSISNNAQIPLMLYDSYGRLIGRHPKN